MDTSQAKSDDDHTDDGGDRIHCFYTSQAKGDYIDHDHGDFDDQDGDYGESDYDTHFWNRSMAKKAMEYIPHRG